MTGLELGVLCLALNIYHEARGEPAEGQVAVAEVVINRARATGRTLCEEVYAPYQFSWTLAPVAMAEPTDPAWMDAQVYAQQALGKGDVTGGALWYHTIHITPWWRWNKRETVTIGDHVFYVCKKGELCAWP